MNSKFPPHLLPRGVFQYVQNAYVDNDKIFKRGGTTIIAPSLGAFGLNGGISFERTNGSKNIIVSRSGASNAQLYSWSGAGSFSAIGTANLTNDAPVDFVIASDRLFGFNGAEVVDVASDGTTVTKNRAGVPIGKYGEWFHNFLFVAGVSGLTNRLYWSALGDPTTFDSADFVDINANDGDSITGISILNDQLLVFKNFSVWAITGFSGATFDVTTQAGQNTQMRSVGVGTPSNRSIISIGRDLYYLSYRGAIPHIRSYNQTVFSQTVESGIVSDELEGTMQDLNKARLVQGAGIFDGKYNYWSLPNGASTTNNLIICTNVAKTAQTSLGKMESWVLFTGANIGQFFSSTISGQLRIYGISSTADGKVYLFNDTSSYEDDGESVVMNIKFRDMMGDPARETKWKYIYEKYQSGSAGTLEISARIDQAQDFNLQESLDLAGDSPGLGSFILGTSILGGAMVASNRTNLQPLTGQMLGIELEEATSNPCEIFDIQLYGYLKGFRQA